MKDKYFHLKFIKKEKITDDVFSFYFDRKEKSFDFLAGQYVHLYLSIADENGRGNSRMFTISSSPREKDYIVITTKKGKTLFKKTLFNLKSGSLIKFYGPSGGLVLNDPPAGGNKSKYIFLSSGIGITPFRSIIKYADQKNLKIPITLLAGFSKKEDFLFLSELTKITKINPNIKIAYSLKRINEKFIKKHIGKVNEYIYYIVGSPSAVASLEEIVSNMRVSDDKIFIEDFEGYL